MLQTLDSRPVDTFALDLRDYTGGDSNVINPLLKGLAQRASALVSNLNFRFYEIVHKATFSSGVDDAAGFKSLALQADAQNPGLGIAARLLVIGEPTREAPSGYGNVNGFTLSASRLTGQYTTKFICAPPGIPAGPSFNPDIAVGTHSTDYFARFDPVLAAIVARPLAQRRRPRAPPLWLMARASARIRAWPGIVRFRFWNLWANAGSDAGRWRERANHKRQCGPSQFHCSDFVGDRPRRSFGSSGQR